MIPGLVTLRHYQRSWLRGDLLAGVTVAAYLVPQVMAYATVAGLPPVAGLWAALPSLVVYAVLGSSASLSMGPEATTALMTVIAIAPLAGGDPVRYAGLAASLALLVGVMSVAAGLLRLGFVADLLSRPVLVGYMAGVALIMIADQLRRVTGVPVTGQAFFAQAVSFARGAGRIQLATVVLAAAVLVFLLLLRARWPRAPGPLLAVLLATAAVVLFGLSSHGVGIVGPVPAGLPVPKLPDVSPPVLRELVLPAFTVLVVGFSDDVLTARSFARRDEQIRANQELLALGVANAGSSLLRGFPVSSSATRTAIGVATGSRTQLYSLTAAASVVAVLLFLRPVLSRFPTAALGAIVIYAAIQLIDLPALRRLAAFRRTELAIALATCIGVLAFNILYGVLVAIGLSVADLLVRVARPHDAVQGLVPGLAGMHNMEDYPAREPSPGWWCTATTRRCSSPTPRTSGSGRSPPRTDLARSAGSCSTSRRTSRWTTPRWRPSMRSGRKSTAEAVGWHPAAWGRGSPQAWLDCAVGLRRCFKGIKPPAAPRGKPGTTPVADASLGPCGGAKALSSVLTWSFMLLVRIR